MIKERTAKHSGLLKCAIFTALFVARYIISKLTDSYVIKLSGYVILAVVGIILFREDFLTGLKDFKEKPFKNTIWIFVGLIANYIAQMLGAIPENIFYPDYSNANTVGVMNAMKVLSPFLYISIMGIIGPIAEEIMFRLILVDKLRNRIPWVIPVIISGVLFGAYHMHVVNVPEFVSCFSHVMSGVVLAIIMVRKRNVIITSGIHIIFNLYALLTYAFMLSR